MIILSLIFSYIAYKVESEAGAVAAFDAFYNAFKDGTAGMPLSEVYPLLDALAAGGATVGLQLHLFLNKKAINERWVSPLKPEERPKVTSFLFPEALARTLQGISLTRFEKEFCEQGRRTVIPVFGWTGCLDSEMLAVCGRGHEDKLDAFLAKSLSDPVLQRADEILAG